MTKRELTLTDVSAAAQAATLRFNGHIPMLLLQGSEKTSAIPLPDFADTAEARQAEMYALGMALALSAPVGVLQQVFLITEGWMSVAKDGQMKTRPGEDPNRREVLVVAGLNVSEDRTEMVSYEMRRGDDNRVQALEEVSSTDGENREADSPLLSMFAIGFIRAFGSNDETE